MKSLNNAACGTEVIPAASADAGRLEMAIRSNARLTRMASARGNVRDDCNNSVTAGLRGERAPRRAQRPAPHLTRRPRTKSRPARRRPRRVALAWAVLALLGLLARPSPALAQTHCNPSDPLELWCATLTVGFDALAVNIFGYFDLANYGGGPGRKGSLSQSQFTYKGVTYTLDDLSIDKGRDTGERGLFFGLSGLGETVFANDARFTLRLGTMDVSLGGSQWEVTGGMTMPNTGLTWANGDMVQVTLTRSNASPTAADNTLTTNEDTQYTFDAGDFNFSDTADRDDTLESVKITALPTAGALSVDGTAILSGDLPKSVSKSDIDAGNLTYTPPPEFNGAATFRFKVNDGYVDSAPDYLMTITIPAATIVSIEPLTQHLAIPEDIGEAVLTVSLDRPARSALSVPWFTRDESAEAPSDYTAREETLTFAAGDTRKTISVPIVDDGVREDQVNGAYEYFYVNLKSGQGYSLGSVSFVIVEIVDNDGDAPPDVTPPLLTRATVNGTTLVLTYNETLDGASTPTPADFVVTAAGSTTTVNRVSVGGSAVTLTLATAVQADQAVTLDYTPGANPTQDEAGNDAAPLSGQAVTNNLDNTAPTVTITGVPGTSSAPFTATFTFSEAVTGFVVGDITLGNATASNFTVTSTTVYTALITPTAYGTVTVDVAVNVAQDAVGNDNTAATQASSTYTAPVITIAAGTSPVTEGTSAAFALSRAGSTTAELTVNATVSETGGDMVAPANEGARTVTFQANSATATLSVPTVADQVDEADGVVTATVTADTATPATYTVGTPSTATVTVSDDDTRGVTVSAETLPVNEGSTGTYTVVLNSQPTASVTVTPSSDNSDVAVSSTLTFTTTNWNMAQPVTVTAAQDSDAVDDAATISHAVMGGDYGAVTAASVAVTVDDDEVPDTTAPRVTSIMLQTPASSPTNANSLTWRVTFSEAVSNVDATDFAVSGTTATLTMAAVSGVTGAYDVTASGGNLAGLSATVTLSFATGQNIQDAANITLTNTAPTGTNDHTYVLDNTAPTVTITGVPGTSSAPFTATFTFSEAVTGFVVGDITLGNATASNFTVTSTTVYTALITPTAYGTVTVDVAVNVAQDAVGNDNTAATQASSTYSGRRGPSVPGAPASLTATAGDEEVALVWSAPADDGGSPVTGYEYRFAAGTTVPGDTPWQSAGLDLEWTVTGLTNGQQYAFEVRASNRVGEGEARGALATPVGAPGALASLTATGGDGEVVLEWTEPADDGGAPVTGYEYRFAAGTAVPGDTPWQSAGLDLEWTVTGLTNGQQYAFEVRARNRVGEGEARGALATPAACAGRARVADGDAGRRRGGARLECARGRWRLACDGLRVPLRCRPGCAGRRHLAGRGHRAHGDGLGAGERDALHVRGAGAEPCGPRGDIGDDGPAASAAGGAVQLGGGGRRGARGRGAPEREARVSGPRLHRRDGQRVAWRDGNGRGARRRARPPASGVRGGRSRGDSDGHGGLRRRAPAGPGARARRSIPRNWRSTA